MNRWPTIIEELPPFPRLLPEWTHAGMLVLFSALAVRTAAAVALGGIMYDNPNVDGYAMLAQNLARHQVLGSVSVNEDGAVVKRPSAYRPPLYPIVLRVCCVDRLGNLRLRRVAVLHVVLGVATTLFVWKIALRCGLGCWSLAAAAVTVLDPLLLKQASLVMTETLATLLVAAALYFLLRRRERLTRFDLAAGFTLGLAALCRPSMLPWIGLLVGFEVARHFYRQRSEQLGRAVTMGLVVALTLSPWMIRNGAQLGKATPTSTHGGYTLLLGNNPDFYEHLRQAPWGAVWKSDTLDQERAQWLADHDDNEVAADRDSYNKAWSAIRESPNTFLYSCLIRLGRFWAPMPHKLSTSESPKELWIRRLSAIWYDAVLVLTLIGVVVVALTELGWTMTPGRRLTGPWLEGLLLTLSLTLVHTFFWSNMRMRAPLTPFLSLLIAAALTLIFSQDNAPIASLVDGDPVDGDSVDGDSVHGPPSVREE